VATELTTLNTAASVAKVRRKLEAIPRGLDKVLALTANKVVKGAQTDAVKIIAEKVNLKQADIREDFDILRATWSQPDAVLEAHGRGGVSLSRFGPTPRRGGKRPKKGLSVKILRRGTKKVARGTFWLPTGTVFRRIGKGRKDIEKAWGPSMMTYYRRTSTLRRVKKKVVERLAKELPRQVRYVLLKAGEL